MQRRLEIQAEDELRYWEVNVDGSSVHLRWGVSGGRVSKLTKELPTPGKANAEARRLIRQHLGRGYVEAQSEG